jgi:UDP-glucose-4-epimerase GalE
MILLAGGAGYIGSHTALYLHERGIPFLVYDNLSRGHREAATGWEFVEGDIGDRERLEGVLRERGVDTVIHFCAYALVGESVDHPAMYFENNVVQGLALLEAMRRVGVRRLVFSSSCAVYGEPRAEFLDESLPQGPINPYGETKRIFEAMLDAYDHAYGLRSVRLRYFNAAGADEKARLGESHDPESHLIPLVLQTAKGVRPKISIFGTDYPTPDGTCVRDYIHVTDLAQAHLLAHEYLAGGGTTDAFNLGYGRGYSVREIIDTCRKVTGVDFPVDETDRRLGDPPRLVADNRKIRGAFPDLDFAFDDVERIVQTAWDWEKARRF